MLDKEFENVLYNFISPVTGKIKIDSGYTLIGDNDSFSYSSPILIDIKQDIIDLRRRISGFDELDKLEKEYINLLTPTLNDSRVKEYLPKKSPRFSELQRLLKLTNQPLFPSCQHKFRNGQTVLREPCDLLRGFIAGVYEDEKPHILVICQQNMGQIIYKSLIILGKRLVVSPTPIWMQMIQLMMTVMTALILKMKMIPLS